MLSQCHSPFSGSARSFDHAAVVHSIWSESSNAFATRMPILQQDAGVRNRLLHVYQACANEGKHIG